MKQNHSDTVLMLRNFIEHSLKRISDTGKIGRQLDVAYAEIKKIQDKVKAKIPPKKDIQPSISRDGL